MNLTNREADVAIRVVYERSALPLNLYGSKGPEVFGGVYMSSDLLAAWRARPLTPVRWILKEFDGIPSWSREGEVPIGEVRFKTADSGTHIAAVRQGLGMSTLPCFVGDADPRLARVPGARPHVRTQGHRGKQARRRGRARPGARANLGASHLPGPRQVRR